MASALEGVWCPGIISFWCSTFSFVKVCEIYNKLSEESFISLFIHLPVDCNSDSCSSDQRWDPNWVQTRARNVAPDAVLHRRRSHWYSAIKAIWNIVLTHTHTCTQSYEHVETCWNCSIYAPAAGKTINKPKRSNYLAHSAPCARCYLIKQKQFNLIFMTVWGLVLYQDHFCHFCVHNCSDPSVIYLFLEESPLHSAGGPPHCSTSINLFSC